MTFLPIVSRELLLASRRRSTYWLRSISGLTVTVIGTWFFLMLHNDPPRDLAMVLFCVLSSGAVLVALSSGPRSTADCISEEKREGTLGLLFLTDLRGYDVILGKFLAGSFHSFYTVVAVLPMMAIPVLMGGGITLNEVGRMALVIINALFFFADGRYLCVGYEPVRSESFFSERTFDFVLPRRVACLWRSHRRGPKHLAGQSVVPGLEHRVFVLPGIGRALHVFQ
jgi:hypothetical protein